MDLHVIERTPEGTREILMLPCDHCEREINTDHEDFWWCEICNVAYCCVACIGCLCSGMEQR